MRAPLSLFVRAQVLDRYFDELSAAVDTLPGARSGKRHPKVVLHQLFGLSGGKMGKGNDEFDSHSCRLVPKELLRNDGEEGCGVGYWLLNLLGSAPLPAEKLRQLYEVRLGPMYVSLAQDLCRLALYCNDSLTSLIEELVAAGSSCSPPLANVLASVGMQAPRLDEVLYAAVPPALQLRVALHALVQACPATHPDAQHMRSAMLHIDSSFAIAPVVNPGAEVSWDLQCPTMLGHLGAFFGDFEARFDPVKRNTIARGPIVQAYLDLLGEAVDSIEAVRTRLARQLLDLSALDLDSPASTVQADDDGWELVARGGRQSFGSGNFLLVERSVNAVVLTRLWPTLEDLLSSVERDKDSRIALGLPAFGWDEKGLAKLVDHLGIPACLLPVQSQRKSQEPADSQVYLPLFYAAASERLRDMMRVKTPEDKAEALAAAARCILVCIEQRLPEIHASICAPCDHAKHHQSDIPLKAGASVSVAVLLQRCLAFTVLRVAHESRSSSFRRCERLASRHLLLVVLTSCLSSCSAFWHLHCGITSRLGY